MPPVPQEAIRVGAVSVRFLLDAQASGGGATAFECELHAGEVVFVPRGAVHAFENRRDGDAKFLAVVTPGVLGPDYFNEIAAVLSATEGPPDPAAIGAVMRRHGLTPAVAAAARGREG